MPFGRSGKSNSRSQHAPVDQQPPQQQQQRQPVVQDQQQQQGQPGLGLSQGTLPTQAGPGVVASAGGSSSSSALPTPSASSTPNPINNLNNNGDRESFVGQQQHQQQQQQGQQSSPLPPPHGFQGQQQPGNVNAPSISSGINPHNQAQQEQQQHPHQHLPGQQAPQQPLQHQSPTSFDPRQQAPLPQPPPGTVGGPKTPFDFARSQSQRYPQVSVPLTAQGSQYSQFSTSVDDLSHPPPHPGLVSPLAPIHGQQQPIALPPQQQPVPEARRSTRKLIKNILRGERESSSAHNNQSQQQQQQQHPQSPYHHAQHSYDNAAGLVRRGSNKRFSQQPQPPSIRTGVSQVSLLEQPPADWQSQQAQGPHSQHPPTTATSSIISGQQPLPQLPHHAQQPSPLHSTGTIDNRYSATIPESAQENVAQDPNQPPLPTLRRVPTDHENSPYGADNAGQDPRQQQPYVSVSGQASPEQSRDPYGQTHFDPSQQQPGQQFHARDSQHLRYSPAQGGDNQQGFVGHLNTNFAQNPETISQLSHESPLTDTDRLSTHNLQTTQPSPAVTVAHPTPLSNVTPPPDIGQNQQGQQPAMPPPPQQGGQPPNRRSQEAEKSMRNTEQPPPGPPPGYRISQAPNMGPLPPPPQNPAGQNPNYRSGAVQELQFDGVQGEGRNSPQPPGAKQDSADPETALKELVVKYKNVKRLYFDGKSQIDSLNGQVEQLQNAVANQRMSQSRTSLDDNEYSTRFNRLNGAINNLSFNIRKDWVTLPPWLDQFVSPEALKTGKQEMTAVGRAVITRWVVDEIFHRCFHPGLDAELSRQLKEIEQNIRRFSYKINSQEEAEALTAKVINWRMTTLEGLQMALQSPDAAEHRADFTSRAATNLTASLFQHLSDPPPAGVDGSASMIVELAVGLVSNMPMESRDVAVTYPMPLDPIQPHLMEVEKTGLPPLPGHQPDSDDDESEEEAAKVDSKGNKAKGRSAPPKDAPKIRFAGFMAVEVRGRQVLMKAPVWTL